MLKILIFSKKVSISEHIKQTLLSASFDDCYQIKTCQTFSALGTLLAEEHDLLIFHLLTGDEEEKICYQFISSYRQSFKMLVLSNHPNASQGMRIFRAGVRGYANTFSSVEKLDMAIKVIAQGDVWMGAEVLQKLLECGLKSADDFVAVDENNNTEHKNSSEAKNIGLFATIKTNLKKWFG